MIEFDTFAMVSRVKKV